MLNQMLDVARITNEYDCFVSHYLPRFLLMRYSKFQYYFRSSDNSLSGSNIIIFMHFT